MAIDILHKPCPDCGSTDEGHATPCGRSRNIFLLAKLAYKRGYRININS